MFWLASLCFSLCFVHNPNFSLQANLAELSENNSPTPVEYFQKERFSEARSPLLIPAPHGPWNHWCVRGGANRNTIHVCWTDLNSCLDLSRWEDSAQASIGQCLASHLWLMMMYSEKCPPHNNLHWALTESGEGTAWPPKETFEGHQVLICCCLSEHVLNIGLSIKSNATPNFSVSWGMGRDEEEKTGL